MADASLNKSNIQPDGGLVHEASFASTAVQRSRICEARKYCNTLTFLIKSTQAGSAQIYEVDEDTGEMSAVGSAIAVTANTLSVTTRTDVLPLTMVTFTPTDGTPGSIRIRIYPGGGAYAP